ncbi:hypothetical protein [Devosia sp.]|uniref:hypothetical protein n=1 Tax=Devosia sp. TaxID=1871048 RepID=UPI0037BF9BEA
MTRRTAGTEDRQQPRHVDLFERKIAQRGRWRLAGKPGNGTTHDGRVRPRQPNDQIGGDPHQARQQGRGILRDDNEVDATAERRQHLLDALVVSVLLGRRNCHYAGLPAAVAEFVGYKLGKVGRTRFHDDDDRHITGQCRVQGDRTGGVKKCFDEDTTRGNGGWIVWRLIVVAIVGIKVKRRHRLSFDGAGPPA